MKGNIKCTITVNNLPDDFQQSGKYLVVRISEGALWYYGAYTEKHRADYAAFEIGNGLVVQMARGVSGC